MLAWRRRAALSGVAGGAGVGLALVTSVAAHSGVEGPALVAGAVALGVIGTVLLVLGQVVQRLLDRTPDGEDEAIGGSPTDPPRGDGPIDAYAAAGVTTMVPT